MRNLTSGALNIGCCATPMLATATIPRTTSNNLLVGFCTFSTFSFSISRLVQVCCVRHYAALPYALQFLRHSACCINGEVESRSPLVGLSGLCRTVHLTHDGDRRRFAVADGELRSAEQAGLFGEEYLGGRGRARSGETADIDAGRAEAAESVAAIPRAGMAIGDWRLANSEGTDEAAGGIED